jgi:hypothetical protein
MILYDTLNRGFKQATEKEKFVISCFAGKDFCG